VEFRSASHFLDPIERISSPIAAMAAKKKNSADCTKELIQCYFLRNCN
jgi:hypothetical protein